MSAVGSRHSEQRVRLLASVRAGEVARAAPELVFGEVKVVVAGHPHGIWDEVSSLTLHDNSIPQFEKSVEEARRLTSPANSWITNISRHGRVGRVVYVDGVVFKTTGVDVVVGVLHQSIRRALLSMVCDSSLSQDLGVS